MTDSGHDQNPFSLTGQVFVVTGASGGIGLEIARGLAAAGASVGLNGRHRATLETRAAGIPNSFVLPFDVTDAAAADAALEDTAGRYGRLDGIVCNAAARDRRFLAAVEPEDLRTLLETNLVAPYQLARTAARLMLPAKRGRIIMMTSLAGDHAMPGDIIYPATKAGLAGLVRSLAVELGGQGINVNGIAPGPIATDVNRPMTEEPDWQAMIERSVPLKRWAEPGELAGVAVFLASAASSYVTGQIITVDGGHSIRMFPRD